MGWNHHFFRLVVCMSIGCIIIYLVLIHPINYKYTQLKILSKIAKHLNKAKLHSRGFKTRDNLQLAIDEIDMLLQEKGSSFLEVTKRKSLERSPSVCPEHYTNTDFGYPLFELGYVEDDCSYSKQLEDLVSFVMVYNQGWPHNIYEVLRQILNYNSKIHIYLAIPDSQNQFENTFSSNVHLITMGLNSSVGKCYNDLILQVKTPYTLVAPFVNVFHKDARLHRLIREIELLNLDIAGGSIRNVSDIWQMGCYQRMEFNYTLVYREGYDESYHDCIFCDHIEGPFVAKTSLLKTHVFNEGLPLGGLFEDFFLRIPGEIAVCPDSMFYVDNLHKTDDPMHWMEFARSRNLYKLSWAENMNIEFDCNYKYPCSAKAGYIIHPCCVNDLLNLTNSILDICEKAGMFCEPHGGSILGPIKMRHTLPWERDTDIRVLSDNFTSFLQLENLFISEGFKITHKHNNTADCPAIPGGYINIVTSNWKADVYPYCNISGVEALTAGLNRTKLWHHDTLIYVPRNPGLAARNRYPGLYKHAEHCSVVGIGTGDIYNKHGFKSCAKKSLCLSRLNMDGSLQFFNGVIP